MVTCLRLSNEYSSDKYLLICNGLTFKIGRINHWDIYMFICIHSLTRKRPAHGMGRALRWLYEHCIMMVCSVNVRCQRCQGNNFAKTHHSLRKPSCQSIPNGKDRESQWLSLKTSRVSHCFFTIVYYSPSNCTWCCIAPNQVWIPKLIISHLIPMVVGTMRLNSSIAYITYRKYWRKWNIFFRIFIKTQF